MITINSTIEEIERMYHAEFHKIPHTETFGILIEKLKLSEELNIEMLRWLKFIQKYISEDDYTALELLIKRAEGMK